MMTTRPASTSWPSTPPSGQADSAALEKASAGRGRGQRRHHLLRRGGNSSFNHDVTPDHPASYRTANTDRGRRLRSARYASQLLGLWSQHRGPGRSGSEYPFNRTDGREDVSYPGVLHLLGVGTPVLRLHLGRYGHGLDLRPGLSGRLPDGSQEQYCPHQPRDAALFREGRQRHGGGRPRGRHLQQHERDVLRNASVPRAIGSRSSACRRLMVGL